MAISRSPAFRVHNGNSNLSSFCNSYHCRVSVIFLNRWLRVNPQMTHRLLFHRESRQGICLKFVLIFYNFRKSSSIEPSPAPASGAMKRASTSMVASKVRLEESICSFIAFSQLRSQLLPRKRQPLLRKSHHKSRQRKPKPMKRHLTRIFLIWMTIFLKMKMKLCLLLLVPKSAMSLMTMKMTSPLKRPKSLLLKRPLLRKHLLQRLLPKL